MALILASASPRRASLLQSAGVRFETLASNVPEVRGDDEKPTDYAARLARSKRDHVHQLRPQDGVIAADTVVAIGDRVLEKPADAHAAMTMLKALSGVDHHVHTAVAAWGPHGARDVLVSTRVRFRALHDDEIERYVQTGESLDKAGAYGIQGHGGALIDQVHGSYTCVVGLPLRETLELLHDVGALP